MNFFKNNKNEKIYYKVWAVEKPKAILQIVHGMAEHIGRYEQFAKYMNKQGILVYGNNHRGHGAYSNESLGYFGPEDGWNHVLDDLNRLNQQMTQKYPNLPQFILGHSMGSFLTRYFIARQGNNFDGVILSGSAYEGSLNEKAFLTLAQINRIIYGPQHKSSFLNALFNKALNATIETPVTSYDWINSMHEEVEQYIKDPYCGFSVTNQFFIDLLNALIHINKEENLKNIPQTPILIIAGDRDPVGNNGKNLLKLDQLYQSRGLDSRVILYKNMRHEILREKVKYKVYQEITNFIQHILKAEN